MNTIKDASGEVIRERQCVTFIQLLHAKSR